MRDQEMTSVFEEVQTRYEISNITEVLGITVKRVGRSLRSDSIDGSGEGKDAFAIYPESNRWYDFKLGRGGDIVDLVAEFKYGGDKKAALIELLPDYKSKLDPFFAERQKFQEQVQANHEYLLKPDLNGHILEYLHSRKLTDEYIAKIKLGIEYPLRLFIPYWDLNGKEVVYYITRRLPDIYGNENEDDPKYKKASLKNNSFLRNIPWGLHTINRDDKVLFITEGAFDAMLLDQAGACVLSAFGGDFGSNWERVINIAKDFQKVILAYDNDEAGQKFTFNAAQKLVQNGINFECAVFIGKDIAEYFQAGGGLEGLLKSTRPGLTWLAERFTLGQKFEDMTAREKEAALDNYKSFLFSVGRYVEKSELTKLTNAVRHYFPEDWLKEVKREAAEGMAENELAQEVIDRFNILYDDRVGAYKYQKNGIWEQLTLSELGNYVTQVLGKRFSARKASAVLKLVRMLSASRENRKFATSLNKMPCLSFKNGTLVFHYEQKSVHFRAHSPDDYATMQANYDYNPDAKSKIFLNMLNIIFDGNLDSIITLQEVFGYSLLNDCRFQKALFNIGCGGNGKSLVTEVLRAMLGGMDSAGNSLVTSVQLDKIGKDFRLMNLKNSWVNVSSETNGNMDGVEARFKILTSGEPIEDSYKNKDPIAFVSRAKLVVNCNVFPVFNDKSRGLERRCLFIDYPINFVENPRGEKDRKLDPNLLGSIINNPEEMAGVFNWALEGLFRILHNSGFTMTESQKKLMQEFSRYNNPLIDFIEETQEKLFDKDGNGNDIKRTDLYAFFKDWATRNNEQIYSARSFYQQFINTLKGMSSDAKLHQVHGEGYYFQLGVRPSILNEA